MYTVRAYNLNPVEDHQTQTEQKALVISYAMSYAKRPLTPCLSRILQIHPLCLSGF
jgi:hypothetical protein